MKVHLLSNRSRAAGLSAVGGALYGLNQVLKCGTEPAHSQTLCLGIQCSHNLASDNHAQSAEHAAAVH